MTPLPHALSTRWTRQAGLVHPVMLAAMDLVADARLSAAVSEAGGLGMLGGGYGDAAWLDRELTQLEAARAERGTRFGVGFITWSLARQPALLERTLAARPEAVWLSFGDPQPFVDRIHAAGAQVVCQVQSVEMARDAVAAGADLIVAQGAEAGGHGVARGTLALVPAVVDAVGAQVPVLAAGGIADGRGLAAALMLGADGVVMGTRLYASLEAAGHPAAKQRIVQATGDDTLRSLVFDASRRNIWPAPYTGRCLLNAHARRWQGRELELLRTPGETERYLAAREAGDFDVAAVIAGEAAALVHDVRSTRELIETIVADAAARLRGAAQWTTPT